MSWRVGRVDTPLHPAEARSHRTQPNPADAAATMGRRRTETSPCHGEDTGRPGSSPLSSRHASLPESPTCGVLQAHPVMKRQIEHGQPKAPGGAPPGPPEGTQAEMEQQRSEVLLALWNQMIPEQKFTKVPPKVATCEAQLQDFLD